MNPAFIVTALLLIQGTHQAPAARQTVLGSGTGFATPVHFISSHEPGPTVLIIGGMHGNEPAGAEAASAIAH